MIRKFLQVYQLSSGRSYYAHDKKVVQTSSINEVVRRITRREESRSSGVRQRSSTAFDRFPCLGNPIDPQESFAAWFTMRMMLYGLPGLVVALISYKLISSSYKRGCPV
ncbi:hypothetical protein GCK32_012866 [Trichostrongylus colubriformis]|uniref:Uncharacterized protein n=1 Tax=Trichostrongylus colubriformis TaxID=6319 RepID=A0AAN8F4M3_TRICO